MSRKPKQTRHFRLDDRHYLPALDIAAAAEVNLPDEVRAFIAWWIREPGARLPRRPPADVVAAARARQEPAAS